MPAVLCSQCAAPLSLDEFEGKAPCKFCGAVNAPEHQRWEQASGPLADSAPIRCSSCGEQNQGLKFCRRCGSVLGATAAPHPESREIRCPQCSKPNPSRYQFCLGCGAELRGAATGAGVRAVGAMPSGRPEWLIPVIVAGAIAGIAIAIAIAMYSM